MKAELPILFQMQSDFIKPLFVSFYYMQLNIFYTLYNRMEELKIPYFDLTTDIVEAYTFKKGNIEEQADAIGITHFKVGHAKSKLEATKRRYGAGGVAAGGAAAPAYGGYGQQSPTYGQQSPTYGQQAPAYGQQAPAYGGYGGAPAASQYPTDYKDPNGPGYVPPGQMAPAATGQEAAPPAYGQYQTPPGSAPSYGSYASPVTSQPPSTPATPITPAATAAASAPGFSAPSPQTCTALYEYTAQAQGDLTFPEGAVIEIVQKTADANGWWTGRYNGQTGVFPGNYVQLN